MSLGLLLAKDDGDDDEAMVVVEDGDETVLLIISRSAVIDGSVDPSSVPATSAKSMLASPPTRPIFFKNAIDLLSEDEEDEDMILVVVGLVLFTADNKV